MRRDWQIFVPQGSMTSKGSTSFLPAEWKSLALPVVVVRALLETIAVPLRAAHAVDSISADCKSVVDLLIRDYKTEDRSCAGTDTLGRSGDIVMISASPLQCQDMPKLYWRFSIMSWMQGLAVY